MSKFNRTKDKQRTKKSIQQKKFADAGWGSPTDFSFIYGAEGKKKRKRTYNDEGK